MLSKIPGNVFLRKKDVDFVNCFSRIMREEIAIAE